MSSQSPRNVDTILEELQPIFRDVFDDDTLVVKAEYAAKDVAGWDSLTHMHLIVAVEERYDMKFKLSEIVKFTNVGDMCASVLRAGR